MIDEEGNVLEDPRCAVAASAQAQHVRSADLLPPARTHAAMRASAAMRGQQPDLTAMRCARSAPRPNPAHHPPTPAATRHAPG